MKNIKPMVVIALVLTLIACSKKDDDGGSTSAEATYSATINGGAFTNYTSTLGHYSPDFNGNGLTLAIVDQNTNTIRVFLNKTGGYSNGVIKTIGNVDTDGFMTGVVIRSEETQQIYNSTEGTITITNSFIDSDTDQNGISGTIMVTATTNTGTEVTISGTFENFLY
tara:strand:- start:4545 stop:5045 length:501 start_codon:yes stop_codon:yes gene_type:complete